MDIIEHIMNSLQRDNAVRSRYGSVLNERSIYGWVIAIINNLLHKITARGSIDGSFRDTASYRAEGYGRLALLITLSVISKHFNITKDMHSY